MITHISQLSEELRKLYTRGRQISTPLHIGVTSIFVRKKKKKRCETDQFCIGLLNTHITREKVLYLIFSSSIF